ncbi:MAG: glycosyltransferase [Spirochaetales bacterium]|nr:glycosyltransferase [Leptospiraceae bacterium]MCP5481549.1 glycosyltransferase [Spirochaetales bacterium]MCP5484377.1 glycosyltransferase [Spirochaetales bacterium]
MTTISVIIPTLNEEEDLPVLLESLKKQSFRDFEIIVADAGSKDGTVKIAKKGGAKVVPGGMPGPGRNRGAEVANGEFLFFFDADVDLPPDFLEKAYAEMQERFLDLATCEFRPKSDLRLDDVMFRFANLSVKMNQDLNPRAAGFCIFITRRLFRRIGGFDETLKLAEDHDLVQRASKFRRLRVLKNVDLSVSVRRLEKEGRFSLIQKYMQVEMHLLFKGNVREDIVEYEFGNFEDKDKGGRVLDDIEARIIQLEKVYNEYTKNIDDAEQNPDQTRAMFDKWKAGLDSAVKAFTALVGPKPSR